MNTQEISNHREQTQESPMGPNVANRPIWLETLAPVEWFALHFSSVYHGRGVPHGHNEPVVVVPGFMADDAYLIEIHDWLERIGYRAYYSGIGRNADCPERLTRRLVATVRRAHLETGKKVTIVGHSLGGMLARAAAERVPDLVQQVVALGSPARSPKAHPWVVAAAEAMRDRLVREGHVRVSHGEVTCACGGSESAFARTERPVPTSAIYSRTDGIVDWRCCTETEPSRNREVRSTHTGMVFNAQVYRALGEILAEAA